MCRNFCTNILRTAHGVCLLLSEHICERHTECACYFRYFATRFIFRVKPLSSSGVEFSM